MYKSRLKTGSKILVGLITVGTVSSFVLGLRLLERVKEAKRISPRSFSELVKSPLPLKRLLTRHKTGRETTHIAENECRSEWQSLMGLDLNQFSDTPADPISIPTSLNLTLKEPTLFLNAVGALATRPTSCKGKNFLVLGKIRSTFSESCQLAASQFSSGAPYETMVELVATCFESLIRYRFELVEFITGAIPVHEIKDPMVLANQLMGVIWGERGYVDYERFATIGERFIDVDNQSLHSVRAGLQAVYFYAKQEAMPEERENRLRILERAVRKVDNRFFEDRVIFEIKMNLARLAQDEQAMRQLADESLSKFPSSEMGKYYLSWLAYLKNDTDTAKAYLREILRTAPSHTAAMHALAGLVGEQNASKTDIYFDGSAGVIPGPVFGYAPVTVAEGSHSPPSHSDHEQPHDEK